MYSVRNRVNILRIFQSTLLTSYLSCRVIELDPENIQAYLKRSYVYLQLQMFNKVIADCTTALNFDKTCFEALYRRAQAAMELEKYSAAVLDIETCIRLGRSLSVSNKWTYVIEFPLCRLTTLHILFIFFFFPFLSLFLFL